MKRYVFALFSVVRPCDNYRGGTTLAATGRPESNTTTTVLRNAENTQLLGSNSRVYSNNITKEYFTKHFYLQGITGLHHIIKKS